MNGSRSGITGAKIAQPEGCGYINHRIYPVRNNAPLLPPGQAPPRLPARRVLSPSWSALRAGSRGGEKGSCPGGRPSGQEAGFLLEFIPYLIRGRNDGSLMRLMSLCIILRNFFSHLPVEGGGETEGKFQIFLIRSK